MQLPSSVRAVLIQLSWAADEGAVHLWCSVYSYLTCRTSRGRRGDHAVTASAELPV